MAFWWTRIYSQHRRPGIILRNPHANLKTPTFLYVYRRPPPRFPNSIPEAFADGKINWDTLREILGENLEDESQEHFGLFWPGRPEARRLSAMPSKGTLVSQPGEGVDEVNTQNLFIEGDNLEVLKLLQKSYAGRVKLIYIDPPYNTGSDFVYRDNFDEPIEDYLKKTRQIESDGSLLTTNVKTDGRFHSNWLTMMYSRLRLARNLLSDEGSLWISIDDNEKSFTIDVQRNFWRRKFRRHHNLGKKDDSRKSSGFLVQPRLHSMLRT